jgi:hypothetical protein
MASVFEWRRRQLFIPINTWTAIVTKRTPVSSGRRGAHSQVRS